MTEQIAEVQTAVVQNHYLSSKQCVALIYKLIPLLEEWDVSHPSDGFVFVGAGALVTGGIVAKAFPHKLWQAPRVWRKQNGEVVFETTMHPVDYAGRRWTLVDEVFDTGLTLRAVRAKVENLGGIVVGSGVLHDKVLTPNRVGKPDVVVNTIWQPNIFIVYNLWECHEPRESLFRQVSPPTEPTP